MSGVKDIVEGALCRIEGGHCAFKVSVETTIKSYHALRLTSCINRDAGTGSIRQ